MTEGTPPPTPPSPPAPPSSAPPAPPPDPGPTGWPPEQVLLALVRTDTDDGLRRACEQVALERKLATQEAIDRWRVRAMPDRRVLDFADEDGALRGPAEDELARRGLGALRSDSALGAAIGGFLDPARHPLRCLAQAGLTLVGVVIFTVVVALCVKTGGLVLAAIVGALVLGSPLIRLVAGGMRFAADLARGRPPRVGLASRDAVEATWMLWVTLYAVPRAVLRTLSELLPPTERLAKLALICAEMIPWIFCFLALLYAIDRGLAPLAAMSAVRRGLRGRWSALAGFTALHAAGFVGGMALVVRPATSDRTLGVLALCAQLVALHFGLARLYAAASEGEARAAALSTGARLLASRPEDSVRSGLAMMLMVFAAVASFGQDALDKRIPLADFAPWLGEAARPVARITLRVVPLLFALWLFADGQLVRRRVEADDLGLLLDGGPRWPGTRIPWRDVVGYRQRDEGLQLVIAGAPAFLGPLVPTDGDDDALAAWLESKGVRGDA